MARLTTGTTTIWPVHEILTLTDGMIRALHAHEHGVPGPYSTAIYLLAIRKLVLRAVAASGR